jgi:transmembrane protein EpsG
MDILWFNLAVVFTFSFFARYFAVPTITTISNVPIKPNKILVFGAVLTSVLISGLRSNIGDTYFYRHAYESNDFTWNSIKEGENIGFGVFQMFLKQYSDDGQVMIFTAALITNSLIFLVLYKYSRMFELSAYVYITSGMYLVSMNGLRQFLTAAIVFTATKFLIDGSWKRYILVVLFASTLHESALILIPIYFLVRFKAWSKATFVLIFSSIVLAIGFDKFSVILFSAIENTQYGHYSDFQEGGTNIFRVAVHAAPVVIAYFGREKLAKIFPNSDYIVNMSILDLVFMIISTQNWIFARFTIYFGLYQLILISWLVKVFSEKDQRLVYYAILVCYLLYFYYEHVISLNIVYRSNFIQLFP